MLERLLAIPGISCPKPNGAFYLFPNVSAYFGKQYQGKAINSASDLAAILLEEVQVAVVPGVAFGNDDFLRFSYATDMDTIRLALDRVETLLSKVQ